jgi:hypothetical protein
MSLLLSRPPIINDSSCSFELPRIRLENSDSSQEMPSPIAHMVLECQLGRSIRKIPGVASGLLSPPQAETIQQEAEKWLASFPPAYQVADPDTQWDQEYQYVVLQRCQLHVVGYMTMLSPLKGYLTKLLDSGSPDIELSFRANAISVSLQLMDASRRLFNCIFPANAKFHFASFMIFDTASFLCSALIRDSTRSLPQREKVVEAIGLALSLMGQLSRVTKTGAICSTILGRLTAKLTLSSEERLYLHAVSPEDASIGSEVSQSQPSESSGSLEKTSPYKEVSILDTSSSIPDAFGSLDWGTTGMETAQNCNPIDFTDIDFSGLEPIWDWENLDLGFDFFSPMAT